MMEVLLTIGIQEQGLQLFALETEESFIWSRLVFLLILVVVELKEEDSKAARIFHLIYQI